MSEKQWRCTVCGYIHVGENPPDVCPVCGVDSSFFELLSGQAEAPANAHVVAPAPVPTPVGNIQHGIKQALYKISYGLFIITSAAGDKLAGQCANTCFQITSDPARVAIGINKHNHTHAIIEASGLVGISILGQHGQDLARNFGYRSGYNVDKFAGLTYKKGQFGVPLLEQDCVASLEGKVINQMDCGTHTLFLLDIVNGDSMADAEPMTYDYFRQTK
ncbi:MAG: flavin reductase [Peptococcaceae bacterium]|nr:flavin reductase [Peptococcaceae bacterium]